MTDDRIKDRKALPNEVEGAAPPGPDERDATIERLERAVAEERQHTETLRKTVEELRFKTGILETSYTKQLEDARLRSDTAERELADQQAQMAALETAHEDAMRLLAEARAELERVPAASGRVRRALASTNGTRDDAESQDGSLTINKLMRESSWTDEQQSGDREEQQPETEVPAEQESPTEELLAPELVFTSKGEDAS